MSINLNAATNVSAVFKVNEVTARITAKSSGDVKATASAGTLIPGAKEYKGEYESSPKSYAQVYETKNMLMKDDFVVSEIQLHEAPNSFGTTITIGE